MGLRSLRQEGRAQIPGELGPALSPLLRAIAQLTLEIKALDVQIEETAEERYPETRLLTQVPGVGTLTAQCFMLTIEDPARFPKARAVASYVGLRPRHADSGSYSPAASDHQGWG